MKKRKLKDKTTTLYWFKIKDLEKKLGDEKRERRKAEDENKKLKEELEQLRNKNKKLEEENENLKECRKTYANMLFKARTQKVNNPRRGRKKGHPGISRKNPITDAVDKEIDVKLFKCPKCEYLLKGCKRKYSRIVENIIIQPKTEIVKYWIHQYECQNCGEKISSRPKDVIGQSPFGKNVFGAALFYRYRMKIPIEKIAECLKEIHGIKISTGGIQNLFYQASIRFGEKYEELKQLLINGDKIHGDETGWKVNGEK